MVGGCFEPTADYTECGGGGGGGGNGIAVYIQIYCVISHAEAVAATWVERRSSRSRFSTRCVFLRLVSPSHSMIAVSVRELVVANLDKSFRKENHFCAKY